MLVDRYVRHCQNTRVSRLTQHYLLCSVQALAVQTICFNVIYGLGAERVGRVYFRRWSPCLFLDYDFISLGTPYSISNITLTFPTKCNLTASRLGHKIERDGRVRISNVNVTKDAQIGLFVNIS